MFIINKKYIVNESANEIADISNGSSGESFTKVEPRIMNLLILLSSEVGKVFSREFLINKIWENPYVGEEGLTQAISRLRKILGDNANVPQIIQTIPKKGYRFLGDIENVPRKETTHTAVKKVKIPAKYIYGSLLIAAVLVCSFIFIPGFFPPGDFNIPHTILLNAKPFTSETGLEMYPSISPDGSTVAFSMRKEGENNFNIYLKSLLTGELKQFTDDSSDNIRPAWNPGGTFISFARLRYGNSEIFIKPVGSGETDKIIECGIESNPTFCWLDDNILIYSDKKPYEQTYKLFLKNIETGKTEVLTSPSKELSGDMSPAILPYGKILFFRRIRNGSFGNIFSINMVDRTEKKITRTDRNVISLGLINDGNNIIYSGGRPGSASLFLLSVKDGFEQNIGGENIIDAAVSGDGKKLIYTKGEQNEDIWMKNLYDNSAAKKILSSTQSEWFPRISPDGKKIAFLSTQTGVSELWLSSINGDSLVQLTHNSGGKINYPAWSPDGNQIVFTIFKNKRYQVYTISPGGGIPRQLFSDQYSNVSPSWSKDSKSVYFRSIREKQTDIWNYNLESKSFKRITYDSGEYGQEGDDGFFYYTRENREYLWRKKPDEKKSELFFNNVHREDYNNWKMINYNIYYLQRTDSLPAIQVYNSRTKNTTSIYTYNEKSKAYRSMFDVSIDEKLLCFTSFNRLETDLMMVELE